MKIFKVLKTLGVWNLKILGKVSNLQIFEFWTVFQIQKFSKSWKIWDFFPKTQKREQEFGAETGDLGVKTIGGERGNFGDKRSNFGAPKSTIWGKIPNFGAKEKNWALKTHILGLKTLILGAKRLNLGTWTPRILGRETPDYFGAKNPWFGGEKKTPNLGPKIPKFWGRKL